ncbi:hypothetical protein CDV31_017060 [Fusarium ambrosium]|uniref:Uncharacterized protein n=1 Tax=Fusarium ambrosium TaxID=131363 RepID=A0A428RU91_9HYPO|nr:hypothetical protein CDV31_017060 [Fusarium ambrosium]
MSSGYPSNPFPRSLDQHIPTTSIEASLPPSIKINHKREQRGRMVGLGDPSNHYNAAECDSPADTLVPSCRELKQDLSQPTNAGVEAEYYISEASEDSVDSFIASNEEYHSEEDLLYRGDYGITGGALPGLFDSLPISKAPAELAPIKPPKMPRSTKRPTIRSAASSNRSMPRKTRQQHSHHSRTGTGTLFSPRCEPRNDPSSDEDSNSFWECTCDMPYGPSFVSLADLDIDLRHPGLDQYGLTEEDDVKVDVHTAVKLRKEMQQRRMESRSRRHMRSSVSNNHVA